MTAITFFIVISIICIVALGVRDDYAEGAWRKSLDTCWTDRSCNRVMTCAHGGEWNISFPYDSMPAFQQAYIDGADAIKGDFRVSKDNIGVVMHSSPVEFYESLNCRGKYVEEMTAEECTQCQMEITQYKFISVPQLLSWAEDKVNVMFCVKRSQDIPRAITSLLDNNAAHRSFLEVHTDDFLSLEVNNIPYWDQVYYVVEMYSHDELQRMLDATPTQQKRGFLLEFHDWENWPNLETDVATAEKAGFRTFAATKDNSIMATVENHMKLYNTGIDVAYTYNLTNAVEARKNVNTIHRITPP